MIRQKIQLFSDIERSPDCFPYAIRHISYEIWRMAYGNLHRGAAMLNSKTLFSIALSLAFAASGGGASNAETQRPDQMTTTSRVPTYTYEVVKAYPHDNGAFTQGLVFHQGALYESTGLNGSSSLRRVELETGKVLKKIEVPTEFFAEGLALFNGRLYQLTWQTQRAFVYDLDSFNKLREFSYAGEGWGLTRDAHSLIMSDGSSRIRFIDPDTFEVQRLIEVPTEFFAEGLALFNGRLYQLTWQTQRAFVYDLDSFNKLREFSYAGEGWGLTRDAHSLIMSDGSSRIRFIDPDTFEVQRLI